MRIMLLVLAYVAGFIVIGGAPILLLIVAWFASLWFGNTTIGGIIGLVVAFIVYEVALEWLTKDLPARPSRARCSGCSVLLSA